MSKSSTALGVIIAIIFHGLLFLPVVSADRNAKPKGHQIKPVQIQASRSKPPELQKRPAAKPTTKQMASPNLKKVVSARASETSRPGQTSSSKRDDQQIPPLRITWRSPQHLRDVVEALGMRIVAVNTGGQIVGEIVAENKPALVEFDVELSQFSNRVRTLPRDFFGKQLDRRGREVSGLWILVPATVDRRLIETQRDAIDRRGLKFGQVRVMDGVFETQGSEYRIVITNLVLS